MGASLPVLTSNGVSAAAVGGLMLDIAGALLLALALITKKPSDAIDAATPKYDFNAILDVGNAKESADAQAGAFLLVLGFAGQMASALGWREASLQGLLVAVVAAGVVDLATLAFLLRVWRRRRIRETLAARLEASNDLGLWWPILSAYGSALRDPPPPQISVEGMTFADYGERLLGARRWKRVVGDGPLPDVMTKLRRDLAGTGEYRAAHPTPEDAD